MAFLSFTSLAQDNSLEAGMMPNFYRPRNEAVLDIALMYYGDHYSEEDLERIRVLLEKRFYEATGEQIKLRTKLTLILPFKHLIQDHPDYRSGNITDIERLQRLWYYDNIGINILSEVYKEMVKAPKEVKLSELDALATITGAQFDGLAYASGRVIVTENPMEVAWGSGGWVEYVSDYQVVDSLIHELGHTLYLDHASKQCQKPGMTYQEKLECCKSSTSKDDVMSYCRNRDKVDENFYFSFGECNRTTIREKIVPAMLKGDKWKLQDIEECT